MTERIAEVPAPPAGARNPAEAPGRAGAGLRATGLPQVLRLGSCAAGIGLDALVHLGVGRLRGRSAEARQRAFAGSAARRVARCLGSLKGVYAKLGQFASLRLDLLPKEATDALSQLRDQVPPLPFATIRGVIEQELGAPLGAHFAELDPTPLGAASIAQVHRGRLVSGEAVAVKVQYPWLRGALPADLAIVRRTLGLASRGLGRASADRERLFEEFAVGVADELDFAREARAARDIAENLADDARVVVPEVFDAHSTDRVLTMRYHEAIPIHDRERLAARSVDVKQVLVVLARAYASQVFVDGHFHADPHPGNLFVLDEPAAAKEPRLLFVDFGLSRRLDPALRDELRRAIYALLQRDLDGFVDGMERLEMIDPGARDGVRAAVGGMFERIAGGGGALALGGSQVLSLKDEAKALLQTTPGLQLPADLLLYAKTMSYVFALGEELDPEVDMMKLSIPHVLRFLAQAGPTASGASPGGDPAGG